MTRYRKKPIEIEAIQFTGDNEYEIADFMHLPVTALQMSVDAVLRIDGDYRENTHIHIPTLEGTMTANCGDWIIKGVKGEFYPFKPDIFEETYESMDRQKLPNVECPICHGVLEDECKHTLLMDLHKMGCFKCRYTTIFEDQINVPAEVHKQRIEMLPDMIRDMHRYRKAKESNFEAVAELDSMFANNKISTKEYMDRIRILAYDPDKDGDDI